MHNGHQQQASFLERSVNWLSLVCAFLITFFATPFAFNASIGQLSTFTAQNYQILAPITSPVWWVILFCSLGLLSNLFLKMVLSGGTVQFIRRFF